MKNSIIYLGIAMASYASTHSMSLENFNHNQKMSFVFENVVNISTDNAIINDNISLNEDLLNTPIVVEESSRESGHGELIFVEKPIEEIVYVDNQIIESNLDLTLYPLNFPYSDEIDIAESNKIIESNFSNEVYPLDFDIINKDQNLIMSIENKVLWTD